VFYASLSYTIGRPAQPGGSGEMPDTSTTFYQVLLTEPVIGGSCIGAKLNKGFL